MIFIFSASFGGFLGLIMLAMLGTPPVVLRLIRLLPGDRRIWWTMGALVAAASIRPIAMAEHDFAEPTDQITAGTFRVFIYGGYAAVTVGWLIGTLILCWIGRASANEPVSKFAWPIAGVVVLCGVFLSIDNTESRRESLLAHRESAVEAIKSGDLQATANALRGDFDLNERYEQLGGHKPFGFAISTGNKDLIKVFLDLPEDRKPDPNQWIGQFMASGDQQLIDLIIDELGGPTPDVLGRAMNISIGYEAHDGFDYALSLGGDPSHMYSYSTLMLAAMDNKLVFAEKLIKAGANVNQTHHSSWGKTGKTAVAFAAENGNLEMVQYLVKHGADITIADSEGELPLNLALRSGHEAVVTYLKSLSE